MTIPATAHHRAVAATERIARMFAEGHDLTTVARAGMSNGWTRSKALEVVAERGWQLDASGRVPRAQRPAVTPGKPIPSAPAGMPGVGTIGGERPVVAAPPPSPGRAQVATMLGTPKTTPRAADTAQKSASAPTGSDKPADTVADHRPAAPASPPDLPALQARARAAQDREAGSVDALLARADNHSHAAVQTALGVVRGALSTLRAALDEAEADRLRLQARVQELDAEEAKLRARLAELDGERAKLLTGQTAPAPKVEPAPEPRSPKTRPTGRKPIAHGTWGGFLKHRYSGQTVEQIQADCPDCYAAKATRGRS